MIGASAGGVEALLALLPALPADLTPAVFVVLHLPRERPSLLVEHLPAQVRAAGPRGARTRSRSSRARSTSRRPTTTCWSTPARRSRCRSTSRSTTRGRRSTCCSSRRPTSTAAGSWRVLLTGANEDGAEGAQAIQRAGGVTVIQEPESAAASAMPASALRRVAEPCAAASARLPIAGHAAVSAEPGRRAPAPVGRGGNGRA